MAAHETCPVCGVGGVQTVDSRWVLGRRYRRKRCGGYGHRWSTAEVPIGADHATAAALGQVRAARAALLAAEDSLARLAVAAEAEDAAHHPP